MDGRETFWGFCTGFRSLLGCIGIDRVCEGSHKAVWGCNVPPLQLSSAAGVHAVRCTGAVSCVWLGSDRGVVLDVCSRGVTRWDALS